MLLTKRIDALNELLEEVHQATLGSDWVTRKDLTILEHQVKEELYKELRLLKLKHTKTTV